ncbi:MAG: TonB-dependent receptor [Pseudomonadota bacterium]
MFVNNNKKRQRFRKLCLASSIALCLVSTNALAQTSDIVEKEISFSTPAALLDDTLVEISRAFGVDIAGADELVKGKFSNPVVNANTIEQALESSLQGTGLTYAKSQSGAYVLVANNQNSLDPNTQIPNATSNFNNKSVTERIIVTGTRIQRSAVNAPSPIAIITSEEIERFGLADNTEALRFVPALQNSVSLTSTNDFGPTGINSFGIASLDLRGLGSARTLVLVNGRRHVAGAQGSASVDVATIPRALLERVEILTGGGSSIYGADAVSGAVNYILKDDFEGIDIDVGYSIATRGGGDSFFSSLAMGGNYADGRGNAVLSIEYNRQGGVTAGQRPEFDDLGVFGRNTPQLAAALGVDPAFEQVLVPNNRLNNFPQGGVALSYFGSFFTGRGAAANGDMPGGFPGLSFVDLQTGELRAFDIGIPTASSAFSSGGDGTAFPTGTSNAGLIPNIDRVIVNANADYEITSNLTFFAEAKYANTDSERPRSSFIGITNVPLFEDNAFIPDVVTAQLADIRSQGLEPNLTFARTIIQGEEEFQRGGENFRETFRLVGGFKGSLSSAFNYELSANYGRTSSTVTETNSAILDRLYAAIDSVENPATGEIVCRSDIDPSVTPPTDGFRVTGNGPFSTFQPGNGSCTPFNIFEPITQEVADFVLTPLIRNFSIEQFIINATATGNSEAFFDLPGGSIGYAFGFEYREEESIATPDGLERSANDFSGLFGPQPIVGGKFDVFEGFAEVSIPVLEDLPFAKSLQLDASIRVADYSTVGTTTSWAVGGLYQPFSDLRIRASFNRAVRAPNISELFTPQTTTVSNLGRDIGPCFPGTANANANRAANCAELVGANFSPTSGGDFGTLIVLGGNPDLQEETADTFTIGFAYSPKFLSGLSFIADFYSIEIDDAILLNPSQFQIADNCVDGVGIDNAACAAITRDPVSRQITQIQTTALNLASAITEGIDYQFNYRFNLDSVFNRNAGDFALSISGNYLIDREDLNFANIPLSAFNQTGAKNRQGTFPRHFLNASLNWRKGPWTADYGFTFQSSVVLSDGGEQAIEENEFAFLNPDSGNASVHFLGGSYTLNNGLSFIARVNNLFDRNPFPDGEFRTVVTPTSLIGRTIQFRVNGAF